MHTAVCTIAPGRLVAERTRWTFLAPRLAVAGDAERFQVLRFVVEWVGVDMVDMQAIFPTAGLTGVTPEVPNAMTPSSKRRGRIGAPISASL